MENTTSWAGGRMGAFFQDLLEVVFPFYLFGVGLEEDSFEI